MELITNESNAIDLSTTPLHLGLSCSARPIRGFEFDPATLDAYSSATIGDGVEGRMVIIIDEDGAGNHWESHPSGDEVLVCLSGNVTIHREVEDRVERVSLRPGQAAINPRGVWHAVDAEGPARLLSITPGPGTKRRAR